MADLKIVISALNKASGDLNKVKQDISGIKDAGEKGGTAVQGFGDSLSGMMSKAALVAGVVAGVGLAMKEVYESAKEAAELDYARDKFDALTDSIGTTSHALLVDLRDATSGLVSDAELVESAGQMMALGLASTHEEATRLATVAGELGMNMNQLVLTLTNQTTMRFDALGVSVAGFDEKVKALEESGLSAQEAFSEAFLQQAEEQIRKVGSVADSSVGSFALMEAGMKNLADAAKANLLDVVGPAIEKIGNYLARQGMIAQAGVTFDNLVEKMDGMLLPTTKLQQEWVKLLGPNGVLDFEKMDEFNELILTYSNYAKVAEDGTQQWADANYEGAGGAAAAQAALIAQSEAADGNADSMQSVADATNNADAAMRSYSESLLFKIASEGLSEESAYNLAIAMGLVDQKTISATKQTNFYQELLGAGIITQRQYNLLIKQLAEDLENTPEEKPIDVTTNVDEVLDDLDDLENRKFKPKGMNVVLEVDDSAVRSWSAPTKTGTVHYQTIGGFTKAVGGAVYGGNPYNWQEYGYKGELFVPSSNGFVMSRADAERALSKALTTGGGSVDPEAIGKAVAKAIANVVSGKSGGGNVYNLTMPTSSNPADVRTAFELMEAWNA